MAAEDKPLSSKKFLVLLMAFIGWTALIWFGSVSQIHYIPLTAMVVTLGFVQISYIFGQAWVDKYVQIPLQLAAAPLDTGSSLAASAAGAIGGVVEAWTGAADPEDPETPPVLLE